MSTRGLIGFKTNSKYVSGYYNHYDSYYTNLGYELINAYFNGKDIMNSTKQDEKDDGFILDGLYCEYAYIYNSENDTLEIYRGFFDKPQFKGHRKSGQYYTHLIMVIDKKKHKIEEVFLAFKEYDTIEQDEEDEKKKYFLGLTKNEKIFKAITNFEKKWFEQNKKEYENRLALEELEKIDNKIGYPEQRIIPLIWDKSCEVCLK